MSERDLRFPTGRFSFPATVSPNERAEFLSRLSAAPARLQATVHGLTPRQLDTPYREGGWTVRQVIHHLPDSHMNSYVRFKLALTEDEPLIKPYDEAAWARLGDTAETPVETSLVLLEALHGRWVTLLRGLTEDQWKRNMKHPEHGLLRLDKVLALYAWHGDHHIATSRTLLVPLVLLGHKKWGELQPSFSPLPAQSLMRLFQASATSSTARMHLTPRRLPHLNTVGQPLFVTFRLHGSLPTGGNFTSDTLTSGQAFVHLDRLRDRQSAGPLYLQMPDIARLVARSILKGGQTDYTLHA